MLIKDIHTARYVMNISESVSFDRLEAHVHNAEATYLIPTLGQALYDKLLQQAEDHNKLKFENPQFSKTPTTKPATYSGTQEEWEKEYHTAVVIWYARHCILNTAYNIGFDELNSYTSNAGFMRPESSEGYKSLFKYQEENLKRSFLSAGLNSIDTILAILQQQHTHFPDFSSQLEKLRSKLFRTTEEFQQVYEINNSRIIFMRLRQHIQKVMDIDLVEELGSDVAQMINTGLAVETITQPLLSILPDLRAAVAYLATMHLMQESGAQITERGLYYTGMRSISDSGLELPADLPRVKQLTERNPRIAAQYFGKIKRTLGTDYPTPSRSSAIHRDNTNKKTFVS